MNKATGERNCLVCGKRVGKNLVLCELCPRAYHTDCHNPVMPKVSDSFYQVYIYIYTYTFTCECIFSNKRVILIYLIYLSHIFRCQGENGIVLIATVNNQRREIVVEGVIPKGEAPEKVKVLIIHQLGDYVKKKTNTVNTLI